MRDSDLHVLLHTLGMTDPYSTRESYRNRFVASDGHADLPALMRLCADGLMKEVHRPDFLSGGDRLFMATEAGKEAAQRLRPCVSPGQRRYHDWLRLSDVMPDLTFGAFLRGEHLR